MDSEQFDIPIDPPKETVSPVLQVPDDRPERSASAEPLITRRESPPTTLVHSPHKLHLDLESKIKDVLNSRPSIRMASRHVLSPVTDAHNERSLSRGDFRRRTLPAKIKSASLTKKTHRKFSSFSLKIRDDPIPSRNKTVPAESDEAVTRIVVQDVEDECEEVRSEEHVEEEEMGEMGGIERNDELRKSTAHLRHRLLHHRQTMDRLEEERAVQPGYCADLRYIKWPKLKSRLQVLFSYKLWKSHLKEVEGHFGTAVVSYFIFLRWLFIMNVLIFALWFGVVVIPQTVHLSRQALNTTFQVSCVFNTSNPDNVSCADTSAVQVYGIQNNCTSEDTFKVQTCFFDSSGVAISESGTEVTVSPNDCTEETVTKYVLCPNVDPHFEWYTYIVDFTSGTGIFNETVLFHGVFADFSSGRFSFDLAFLVMVGIIYTISVLLLVYKMGYAFNESYVQFGKKRKVNFCNKLFTAWDFNITHPKTAKLRQAHIKTDFQEELADTVARERKRTLKELLLVIFIRIGTNLFVLVSLVGAAAAIYYSAQFELDLATNEEVTVPIIGEYISAIVISVLNAVYPFVFSLIAQLERYKTASGGVTITLIRTIMVRLSSLLVLLSSLYNVISSCTIQNVESDESGGECTFSGVSVSILSNGTDDSTTCPECWETFIGQQFFKLALTNLLVALGATISIESGRNLLSHLVVKIKHKNLGVLLSKVVKRGNFNIPRSILDLIYTQSLLWLGFLFSPLLPFVVLLTSFFLFYIKKYSLLYNLDPDKKGFARTAKTNFLFLFLMLLALFASVVPVLYAVTQLRPSDGCGPFRGQSRMYDSITLLVESWSCTVRIAVDFFASAAFVVPLIIFLLLVLYAMYVVLKARDARFRLIKKQLMLEGANVTHIVGHLDTVLLELAEERAKQEINRYSRNPQYLEEVIKRYSSIASASQPKGYSTTTVETTVF